MRKTIRIRGMSCRHCVMAVTKALEDMEGVENVTVNLERGEASFDETRPVDRDILRQRVEDAGYALD
ncbi:MAG TPA: cation transporter [Syntrophales bacterium]|nr:cation transporter [Syntrophales bacterium]